MCLVCSCEQARFKKVTPITQPQSTPTTQPEPPPTTQPEPPPTTLPEPPPTTQPEPPPTTQPEPPPTTLPEPQIVNFEYAVEIESADLDVDILFVVDNSQSMAIEQANLGNRFPTFISSISSLNWRIAMVTTDMSSGGFFYTGSEDTRKGNLLPFSSGQYFLEKNSPNANSLFLDTIKRPEIGSGDERGIYAAITAIKKNATRPFIRENAKHLSIVILSDEDERSNGGEDSGIYPMEKGKDYPKDLIDIVNKTWSSKKTLTVHSIVVQEGDSECLNKQRSQDLSGGLQASSYYGKVYSELTRDTEGILGNICAEDYGSQLKEMGDVTTQNVSSLVLACPPINDYVEVRITPEESSREVKVELMENKLIFTPTLQPGHVVHLKYSCYQS